MLTTSETLTGPSVRLQRSRGAVRLSFKRSAGRTVLDQLYQQGCHKARFPGDRDGRAAEAILINTSGGLTDGDRLSCTATWQAGTKALITTQAAERIYRSRKESARIDAHLQIGARAAACWLPQETILFDRGRLDRTTDVDMAADSSLFAVDSAVFGRAGMGETTASGFLIDRWRIRVAGRLAFADAVLLDDGRDGRLDKYMARAAIAGGARAVATIVYVGPDCATRLPGMREALAKCDVIGGASDLGPLIVARVLADDGLCMRGAIARVFAATQDGGRGFRLPRVWNC